MADTIFSNWLTALQNLQSSVSKDLSEIRKQKAEIQQLKADILNEVARGKFIRDDERIVLSAPEIVIGNVDASGMLYGDSGGYPSYASAAALLLFAIVLTITCANLLLRSRPAKGGR